MTQKGTRNIMLAFVSLVNENSLAKPIRYADLGGKPYIAIQTNESAIIKVQRELGDNPLDGVFLISSERVKTFDVAITEEYGVLTHINFLKKRLIEADPRLSDKLIDLDYYEDLDDIEESMRNVTQIAERIMAYAQSYPEDNICLYADMTGGFRYNSVMMLVIMQLLQYNGIKLGRVLYSDPQKKKVFNATSLLGLFRLVSGADEFVTFGSVEGLQNYFREAPKTKELDELLQSMQRFSEAIKMCRTGIIKDELKTLNVRLQAFQEHHGGTLQEELFASIILTLRNEYSSLLQGEATEFDIIRWCERKGFLQQAMTLCTEWLPAYLVNKKIAYADEPRILLECEREGRKTGRSWQQYFLTVYNKGVVEDDSASTKPMSLSDLIKAGVLAAFSGHQTINVSKYQLVSAFYDEISQADFDFTLVKSGLISQQEFEKRYPVLGRALHAVYDDNRRNVNFNRSYKDYFLSTTIEKVVNKIATFRPQEIYALFEIPAADYQAEEKLVEIKPEIMLDMEEKWKKHVNRYEFLYRNNALKSKCRYKTMLECLHEYFLIRTERNQINHANTEDMMSVAEVRALILKMLDHWEQVAGEIAD